MSLAGNQFRAAGSTEYIDWLDGCVGLREMPKLATPWRRTSSRACGAMARAAVSDQGAEGMVAAIERGKMAFDIVDDPEALEEALRVRARAGDSVRLVAAYGRPWKTKNVRDPHALPPEQRDFNIESVRGGQRRTWSKIWNYAPAEDYTLFVQAPPGTKMHDDPLSEDSNTITGMTFIAALQHLVLRKSALAPNVVLVEEAGQLPLAHGLCTGLIGAGSILMFGDDLQMPPVFPSEVADDPLATSLLGHFRASQPHAVSMLQITYRLNRELCDVIGRVFYASALRSSADASDRRFTVDITPHAPSAPIAQALSSDASFVCVCSSPGYAQQANLAEAQFVANIIHTCRMAGLSPDAVAVVTPFRRQAALIRRAAQSRLPTGSRLPVIDTVERVQGLTVELVVVSLCTSAPAYAQSVAAFLCSPNRLNVAVSRARTKAILVASSTLAETQPPESNSSSRLAPWQHLLEMASSRVFI